MSHKYFIIVCLIGLCFFLGLGQVHLFDWDELNFAESAREMLLTADYFHVQVDFVKFWEKPPLFFWLQSLSMAVLGVNEYAARLPNALFGLLTLLTLYYIGKEQINDRFGLLLAVLFGGSLLPHFYFKSGIIDPIFNYFIFLSIYCMLRGLAKNTTKPQRFIFFSALTSGLAVLAKGPVGFLLLALTTLITCLLTRNRITRLRSKLLIFVLTFGLVTGLWFGAYIYLDGLEIFKKFILYQIELFSQPVAGHEQPFYYHFVVVFLGCFPISILALPTFRPTLIKDKYNMRIWMLSLFWIVMVIFSISKTKIVHYSSMSHLPLAYLATLYIYKRYQNRQPLNAYVRVILLIIGLLLGSIIGAIPIFMVFRERFYPYIDDAFALANLQVAVGWTGFEAFIGFGYLILLVVFSTQIKSIFDKMFYIAFLNALLLLLALWFIVPKIEGHSQRSAIDFYKKIAPEKAYISTVGFKSYAHLFYFQQSIDNPKRYDQSWLLQGDLDKTAYFVTKLNYHPPLDQKYSDIKLLYSQGGFNFYKRNPF